MYWEEGERREKERDKDRERECEIGRTGRRAGIMEKENGMDGVEELRRITNSSHINKCEDTDCEAAEKPSSLFADLDRQFYERILSETY